MEHIVTVVGRNRRVYTRVYKRDSNRITRMAEHYYQMEAQKSAREGFRVTGMTEIGPIERDGVCIRVFRIQYAEGNRIELRIPADKFQGFRDLISKYWMRGEPIFSRHVPMADGEYEYASFSGGFEDDIKYVLANLPEGSAVFLNGDWVPIERVGY